MREVGEAGIGEPARFGCGIDGSRRQRVRVKGWCAAGCITGRLKRQAAGVGGVILHLPMRSDFCHIVIEAVRPHAVLGQKQRYGQKKPEKGAQEAVQDGPKYKAGTGTHAVHAAQTPLTVKSSISRWNPLGILTLG